MNKLQPQRNNRAGRSGSIVSKSISLHHQRINITDGLLWAKAVGFVIADVTILSASQKNLYEAISKMDLSKQQNISYLTGLKRTIIEITLDR